METSKRRVRVQTNISSRIGSRQRYHISASGVTNKLKRADRRLEDASDAGKWLRSPPENHQGQCLLFSDKFVAKRCLTKDATPLPASADPHGSKQPPLKPSDPHTKKLVLRQQSTPNCISASSWVNKLGHQSIPNKSSPRLPQFEKRHSIHPSPLIMRQEQQLQDNTVTKPDKSLQPTTRQCSTSAVTHTHSHTDSVPKPRSRVYRGRCHSLSPSSQASSRDRCKASSLSSCRKHQSAIALSRTHSSSSGGIYCESESDGVSLDASFAGESTSLEDTDGSEFGSLLEDIREEENFLGSEGEMDNAGALFEEDLTDLEDNGDDILCDVEPTERSGKQSPLTCVQKSAAESTLPDIVRECTSSGIKDWRFRMLDFVGNKTTHTPTCFDDEVRERNTSKDSNSGSWDMQRTNKLSSETENLLPPTVAVSLSDTAVGKTTTPLEVMNLLQDSSTAPSLLLPHDGTSPVKSVSHSTEVMESGGTPWGSDQPSPPLTPSLFSGLPPTIHFPLPHESYSPFPKPKRALLKWKMSTITPNVVKICIARVGFSECTGGNTWIGYWGKHMTAEAFKGIREYQKVNHFPGTFQIGRKDRLWRNLSKMQARVGKKECDFVPQTFVLPQDMKQLRREWEDGNSRKKWILKPPAAARGIGIRVVHRWAQIPKKKPVVVQRYIADPFLINGSKFDLRVYVYVSCYDPLRIYVFKEGLTRFATCRYSSSMKALSNRFMHLTNYSVNKKNADFVPNSDETQCQGHKWGLLALWRHMRNEMGINTREIWESIQELIVKTIISSEPYVASLVKACVRNSHSCHELFGFDIMLDRRLKPWILEVNISPSLHSNSQLDINIKGRMMRDILNMAGFHLPSKETFSTERSSPVYSLSTEERSKHAFFLQKPLLESERRKILDSLTPDDTKVLMETEDEYSRCGSFERVYPSPTAGKYRRFFETERYYNILLTEWAAKYSKNPRKGISLLQRLQTGSTSCRF